LDFGVKFSPVIIITVPPAREPTFGETEVTFTTYEKSSSVGSEAAELYPNPYLQMTKSKFPVLPPPKNAVIWLSLMS
jgi:hypothetical protein